MRPVDSTSTLGHIKNLEELKNDPEVHIAMNWWKLIEWELSHHFQETLDENEIKKIYNENLEIGTSLGKRVYAYQDLAPEIR